MMNESNTESASKLNSSPLLYGGVIAGPMYILIGVLQILLREGFDPTRHPLSLMSLGEHGWIQITNFLLSGVLVVAGAIGIRRAMRQSSPLPPGRLWGPLLLGVYGISLIGAGMFVADAMDGFPPGTPPGPPQTVSWHGGMHFMAGGIGFLAVIASCMIFCRYFISQARSGWGLYSAATGLAFLAGFVAIGAGGGAPWSIIAFTLAVILIWLWISLISYSFIRAAQTANR